MLSFVEQVYQHLCTALRHGARASHLLVNVPDLIDLLYPAGEYPELAEHDRALRVESDIRAIIDGDIGGDAGEAVAIVLTLRPGTLGRTLGARRAMAASRLAIEADTFRRPWYEKALLFHIAVELYRRHHAQRLGMKRRPHRTRRA